jgi:hypothetical protein
MFYEFKYLGNTIKVCSKFLILNSPKNEVLTELLCNNTK